MKFLVALTAVVALATVNCQLLPDYGQGPLYEDIQYFTHMIPMEKVAKVVMQYAVKDAEFKELLKYIRSSEFKEMMVDIEAIPEFHNFATYMQNNGVYMYDMLNDLNKAAGLPSFQPLLITEQITGGLRGLFLDVKALINYDDIIHGYAYKMRTSQAFRDFVTELKSTNHQKFINQLYEKQRYLSFRNKLVSNGLDITLVEDVIFTVLGVEFPVLNNMALYENRLSKDIHDFIDLVDMDKIVNIVSSYMQDDQVQEAIHYMKSEEFHALVHKVEALEAYQNGVQYLQNAGLNIHGLLQKIHKLFGMEDYVPPSGKLYANLGGVKAMVDAVRAALPMDQFKAMFQQKMQTSPDFKTFVEKLQSSEFQVIVNTIYKEPFFLEMRQKAKDAGLDLDSGRHLFEEIGIKLPRPSAYFFLTPFENRLSKDIHDFIDLVDMDKIVNIVSSYMQDDQVQEAIHYMKSEEFHALVRKVEALEAYQNGVQYLQNAGLNIHGLLQKIHKLFGMEDYVPPSGKLYANLGGVKAMVDAVRAALPMDQFKALFQQKMQTSPDFKAFVEKLQSPEFQVIVNTIYKEPFFLEMRQKAKDAGLDLDSGRHLFEEIGIKLPRPSAYFFLTPFENRLSKDIHDFIDLVDMDKIVNIVSSYMQDDQVQEAIHYMKSEEFHALVRKVEALEAYQNGVQYLQNAGLNIHGLLQKIHKLFGMEDYVPPSGKLYANLGGVKAMVDAVRAALPMDQFKALFQQKMQTSPDFKTFVEKLQSSEFQVIVNTIYKEPFFLEMRQKAKDAGLDLDSGRHLFEEIGIKLPRPSAYFFLTPFENRLSKDIHDFIDLVDMDKIVNIVSSYMQDDQVQEAIHYMKSEEFHALVRKVEALEAYQNGVQYLQNAGLNIHGLLQKIHKLFGMEDYVPPSGKLYANLGGVKAMVDAVRAALPMDQFKALFQQKMQTSPDFKTFVEKLQSSEFQVIVNTIYKEPFFLEMRQKAKDAGLDLDSGRHLFEEIGIKLPRPSAYFFLTPFENRLSKDIHDFIDLVDMDKIVNIVSSYMQDDQVQEAIHYMKSEEFHALVRKVEALEAYQNGVQYLQNAGLNIHGLLQKIHKLFGMEDYVPPSGKLYANLGGVKAMVDAVRAALPMDQFKALFQQKMQTSPDFKTFVEKLQSSEFQVIVNTIYKEPFFLEMRQKAKDAGLDLDSGRHLFEEIGIKLPRPSAYFFLTPFENRLSKDIHDFIDLVDMDKIVNIVSSYMQDDQVQEAIHYMKSEEFHALVRKVEALEAYQNGVQYLQNAGLNIHGLLQKIHKLFGMEDYVPPSGKLYANLGGVKAMVDAVRAALPMDQFKALFQQKMQTSPDFKAFVEKLQSPEFQVIVNTIYKEPFFLEMRQKAKDAGLDLDSGRHLFEEIGIKLPRPSAYFFLTPFENRLSKDIHDFIDLVDMDKIVNIVSSYMQDDQVQEAIHYMKSEEFHALVRKVEALKAYQNGVQYLHNAGLNIHGLLQKIHKLFGMEDYVPPSGKLYANLGGVKAMIDAVRAALPMDQFKALFQQKMQTSPDFKAFVEKLQSPEFQVIVNTIYKEPFFLEMRQKAKDAGLDLDSGRHLFEEIGIKLPRPSAYFFLTPFENRLSKDIHDFIDLVDMDKIVNIVSSYMQDDQVQEAIHYMKSEEFHALVRKVEALEAYQNGVQYLQNAGLNIHGLLQKIHKLFGMEDYVPPSGKLYANLGGVKAMVDAVRAALPMDQFKALFQQKMQTSPDFKTFVEKLQSSEFQVIVDTIYKEPIFLEMRQKAKDVGLDLDRGRHLFEEIGIKLPRPAGFVY